MRALITGITGFVGGFLAEHLLASGDQVLGTSAKADWPDGPPAEARQRISVVEWDLGDDRQPGPSSFDQLQGFAPDCIYHLAALSVPAECGQDEPSARAMAINVDGTRRVLELAARLAPRPRVLFVSSSHVYEPPSLDSPAIDETWPVRPARGYGQSKLAAEKEVLRAARQDGLDVIISRSFQHTGPRQTAPLMLPEWCARICDPKTPSLCVRNRSTWIDLSDVRDVVRAYRLLIERGQPSTIYNVGSGVARRTGEVLEILLRLSQDRRPVEEMSPGPRRDPIANIQRLVQATGWQTTIPLEQTVADTLDFWRRRKLT